MANASWIDAEALEPDDDDDENEMWHVVISDGEVKTVTLEQLDDFFRLDVIDVNTKVWGPDMKAWTTLGEALGIEEDDDGSEEISVVTDDFSFNPHERPTVKQSLPPPPFAPSGGRNGLPRLVAVPEPDSRPRSYSPPPKLTPYAAIPIDDYKGDVETVAKAYVPAPRLQPTYPPVNSPKSTQTFGVPPRAVSPYGAPSAGAPRPPTPAPSVFPAPASASSYPPAVSAYPPAVSAYPPAAAPRSAYPAALEQPGASLRPAALDIPTSTSRGRRDSIRAFASDPDIYVPRPSRFGAWLMAAAVLAGAVVTLYRNDIIRDVAHKAGQDAAYARLEAALGGPAFGTLRSLEHATDGAGVTSSSLGATSLLPRATEPKAVEPQAEAPKAVEPQVEAPKAVEPQAEAPKATAPASRALPIDALPTEAAKPSAVVREAPRPVVAAPAPVAARKQAAKPPVEVDEPLPESKMKAAMSAFSGTGKKKAEKAEDEPAPRPAPAAKKAKAEEPAPMPGGLPPSLEEAIRDRATRATKKTKGGKAQSYDTPSSTPPAKKKKAGSEYDPLNSDL